MVSNRRPHDNFFITIPLWSPS